VNDRDPSGLAAGPARPPKSVCANSHDKGTCETAVKREESCGRLGCKDASEAHRALPEAIGVGLFVTTGGLGDLAEEGIGEALSTARTALTSDEAASAGRVLNAVGASAVTSVGLRNLEEHLDATANNPSAPPITRGVASFDAGVIKIIDPISTWHDEWDIFNGE
jgi:hypothetical protein